MKQVIRFAIFFAICFVTTSAFAQLKINRLYGTADLGFTFPYGSNSALGMTMELKNGFTVETEYRRSKMFSVTGKGNLFGTEGNIVQTRTIGLSVGKNYNTKNGFGNLALGATYGSEKFGKGGRFLMISSGRYDNAKVYNYGGQISWRSVLKLDPAFGIEMRTIYNFAPHFSALQVAFGIVLGKL
jgi:hypothetical protein